MGNITRFGSIELNGKTLVTTDKVDIEWTARMLYGEAGADCAFDREGSAVLWTMINRFAMLYPMYKTFTSFIRAYSQPINPAFYNGGSKDKDPGHVDDRELRREAIAKMILKNFPQSLLTLVENTLNPTPYDGVHGVGKGVAPPDDMVGLVHFYSPCFYYAKHLGVRQRNLTPEQVEFACRTGFGGARGIIWSQPDDVNPQGNAFYRIRRNWPADKVRVVC